MSREALERLSVTTYAIFHNPNCARPYQLRFVGKGMGTLDNKPKGETKDQVFHGKTLDGAVRKAARAGAL